MAKTGARPAKQERKKKSNISWAITIFFITIVISGAISLASNALMEISGMIAAFFILLFIILLGIIFDVLGVAVTSAEEEPFHSMAAKKVPGAAEAIRLLRNADKVATICNDVVGDICGVISGCAAASIAARVIAAFDGSPAQFVSLALSALVAGLTVGGKAVGKGLAIRCCTAIVFFAARVIHMAGRILPGKSHRKKKHHKK